MPELPEVEVVRRGLVEHVVGRQIASLSLRGARVARRHAPGPVHLSARLTGTRIEAADRRGKYLWLVLRAAGTHEAHPMALVVHLGMSGQLLVQAPDAPDQRHLHARFGFADARTELRFVDQRTFGGMALAELVPDPAPGPTTHGWGIPATLAHIAPDPLEPAFDRGAVVSRLRTRHTAVKRALLDQGLVSGIGNIYADEALWRAGVHGERETAALTSPALGRLLDAAREVMSEALAQGGTSFDALYVNVNGASGYFDRSLHAYGQHGRPCPRCGAPIRREGFMNRSSFSCPVCQPRPRRSPGRARPSRTPAPPRAR